MLDARGVPLSKENRAKIVACSDAATLDSWLAGAGTATSADELLRATAAPSKNGPQPGAPPRNRLAKKSPGKRAARAT